MHISGAQGVQSKPRGPGVCARSGPCVLEGLGRLAGLAGTRVCVRECALTRSRPCPRAQPQGWRTRAGQRRGQAGVSNS